MVNNKKKGNKKKNKSRILVKVEGFTSATATKDWDMTTAIITATMTKTITCFHGSTAEAYDSVCYKKAIDEWGDILKQSKSSTIIPDFLHKHQRLVADLDFWKYIFSFATRIYLDNKFLEDNDLLKLRVRSMVRLGIICKYNGDKINKYCRDIDTDRGIIKCLARETLSASCECMKASKLEAQAMEKLGGCFGCTQKFPKMQLRLCSRCKVAKFCSNECMKKNWSEHKANCNLLVEAMS
mmetsp:Transcript_3132/g.3530  ORF Transcript_3132/g.3530 Transcript_3132/m.3530 type:complete len:239 (+) Transcript_3132:13-729(+)